MNESGYSSISSEIGFNPVTNIDKKETVKEVGGGKASENCSAKTDASEDHHTPRLHENHISNTYDSGSESEIPTEENYLRSSTSVSTEEELDVYPQINRPRSVHFEDEVWFNNKYVSKALSKSDGLLYSKPEFINENNINERSSLESSGSSTSSGKLITKPSNVRSERAESVREMLRKRRQEVDLVIENDGRRRINSQKEHRKHKYYSTHENQCDDNETKSHGKKTILRSSSQDRTNLSSSYSDFSLDHYANDEAAFISRRSLAVLHSLVSSTNSSSSSSSSVRSREVPRKVFSKSRKRTKETNEDIR